MLALPPHRPAYLLALLVTPTLGCATGADGGPVRVSESLATVTLGPAEDNGQAHGTARLWQRSLEGGGLKPVRDVILHIEAEGLSPGEHGVAITTAKRCDATTQGAPHFDPLQGLHGVLWDVVGHAGDLGNLSVDGEGRGSLWIQPITAFALDAVAGKTLVVYAHPDDGVTQPAGGTGAVILCGVIREED